MSPSPRIIAVVVRRSVYSKAGFRAVDQTWVRCRARRKATCVECDGSIYSGDEVFRPGLASANAQNRSERMHAYCAEKVGKEKLEVLE